MFAPRIVDIGTTCYRDRITVDQPKNPDEFLYLLDQAIIETEEIIACSEDEDEFGQLTAHIDLYKDMLGYFKDLNELTKNGGLRLAQGEDFPIMDRLRQAGVAVPFVDLIGALNDAYRKGF